MLIENGQRGMKSRAQVTLLSADYKEVKTSARIGIVFANDCHQEDVECNSS